MRNGMARLARALWVAGACSLLAAGTAAAKQGSCDEPILLGTTISMTGPQASLTPHWDKLTQVFTDAINKDGGIMLKECGKRVPIKFVVYDDQSNPAVATQLYEKMATVDNVDFFVGTDWSFVAAPVSTVAEKYKIPLVAGNVATPSVFERGLQYFWAVPYVMAPHWSDRYFDMLAHMEPRPKTIFFVVQDNPVYKAIAEIWSKKAAEQGMTVVGNEMFPGDLKDFSSIVLKIRAAKPDVVYISSFDNPSVPLIQQMHQMRVKAMDVHHAMLSRAIDRQTKGGIEGMSGENPWAPGVKGDYADFTQMLLDQSGIDVFESQATFPRITSYLVMMQAIERAGAVDREKLRAVLTNGTFKSPTGDIHFDAHGVPDTTMMTVQVQDGKVAVVWPPALATAKPLWPSPGWK